MSVIEHLPIVAGEALMASNMPWAWSEARVKSRQGRAWRSGVQHQAFGAAAAPLPVRCIV
jgi:hypothetical protein